jgi:hypothetical protein
MNTSSSSVWGKKLAVTGSVMQLAFVVGLSGTIVGMVHAFETLGAAGTSDPSALSAAIGQVLWSTVAGITIAAVGAILMSIALFGMRYRARWFFWCLMVTGVIWLGTFPPLGLLFLIYGIMKRKEFPRDADWTNLATPGAA